MPLLPPNTLSGGQLAIGGLAEGLKQGLLTYRDLKQQDFENRQKNALLTMAARKQGFDYDPSNPDSQSTGLLDTPLSQAKTDQDLATAGLGKTKAEYETSTYNPESDASGRSNTLTRGLLNQSKPGSGQIIPQGSSAKEIADNPLLKTFVAGEENVKGRKAGIDATTNKTNNKRFSDLGDALDPNKGRAGEFGRQAQMVNNADRVLVLAQQYPDLNLPRAQMGELASASANLVGGGGAAEATIHRYVPKNVWGDAAGIEDWFSKDPHGANQQGFAKAMVDSAQRERALAQQKLDSIRLSRVAQFSDLENEDPGRFNSILSSKGIEPEAYQTYKRSGYKQAPAPSGGSPGGLLNSIPKGASNSKDAEAMAWAKANPNDPRAKKIFQMNGM